jgi:hypothetical protein
MKLDEAKELREELEQIEATMVRIKALWGQLPSAADLDALGNVVCEIASAMDDIVAKARQLSKTDEVVAVVRNRPD